MNPLEYGCEGPTGNRPWAVGCGALPGQICFPGCITEALGLDDEGESPAKYESFRDAETGQRCEKRCHDAHAHWNGAKAERARSRYRELLGKARGKMRYFLLMALSLGCGVIIGAQMMKESCGR